MTAAYQILPDDSTNTGKKVDCEQVVVNGQNVLQQKVQVVNTLPVTGPVTDAQLRATPIPVTLSGNERELIVTTYFVKTAFTGASVNDTITCTQILDVTGTPSTAGTVWRNQTTGIDLGTTPSGSNLTLVGSQALTDAQIRATPLPVTVTSGGDSYSGAINLTSGSGPATFNCDGKGTVVFTVTGTWVGSIIVEASPDNVNWYADTYVSITSGGISTTFSANTAGQIGTIGLDYVRLRSNTISSGTAVVNFYGSPMISNVMLENSLPTGSNTIGNIGVVGTVPLPTGAATESGNLATIVTRLAKGVATSTNSLSVTPASDAVMPVSGSGAAGTAPTHPPLSVSGVDGSGNKQHLKVDTSGNLGTFAATLRSTVTASIANGASTSGWIDLTSTTIVGFIAPSAWTSAALNFEASPDNGTTIISSGLFDGFGTATASWNSLTASAGYSTDVTAILPWRYIRLRSGTAASPVVQGAQRDFTIITRPLA